MVDTNSGKDVPNATINNDKNTVDRPKKVADFNKEKTSNFAEKTNPIRDNKNMKPNIKSDRPLEWSWSVDGSERLIIKI